MVNDNVHIGQLIKCNKQNINKQKKGGIMKKLMLLIALLACNFMLATAQENITLLIEDRPDDQDLCIDDHQTVIVYAEDGCEDFEWIIDGVNHHNVNPITIDWQHGSQHDIVYRGYCNGGYFWAFWIFYHDNRVPTPFTHYEWKRQGSTKTIEAVGIDSTGWDFPYSFLWSTGDSTRTIDVIRPDTCICDITHWCGSSTRNFIVWNSVEIFRAGVDLATGWNKLTWQVDPEMVGVYDQVEVLWKGGSQIAGYAPYEAGEFLHEGQGSDDQSWKYSLVGITYEGIRCPIESYQKGTPHGDYFPINEGTRLKMTWTLPFIEEGAPCSIDHIEVYKYEPSSQQLVVVSDWVEADVEEVSFPIEQFNNGQAVLGFVFNDGRRDNEEVSFTNLSEYFDLDDIAENSSSFKVYPNPASSGGIVTVEEVQDLKVYNLTGQLIFENHSENEIHHFSLELPGAYFIQSGEGIVKKVVVK